MASYSTQGICLSEFYFVTKQIKVLTAHRRKKSFKKTYLLRIKDGEESGTEEPLHVPVESEVKQRDREQAELCESEHYTQSSPLSPLQILLSSAHARTHTHSYLKSFTSHITGSMLRLSTDLFHFLEPRPRIFFNTLFSARQLFLQIPLF